MEIRIELRKFTIMSVRKCYRSVCNHPFLVGFVCFLFLLYRSFPLLFSLLISASPVLVCTIVLLGTLLSFGEPHLPEIEKEESVSREMSPLRTEEFGNSSVIMDRGESSTRFLSAKRDIIERAVERVVSSSNEVRMLGKEVGLLESIPLIHDHSSLEAGGGNEKREPMEVDSKDEEDDEKEEEREKSQELDGSEVGEHQYSLIEEVDGDVGAENGELKREIDGAHVESSVGSEMNGVDKEEEEEEKEDDEEEEEEEDDDDGSLDCESDRAESSSADASVTDILSMLDELHPLLEGEDPLPKNLIHNESHAVSEHSHQSQNGIVKSDDDSANLEEEDDDEEEEEDDDEEEEDGDLVEEDGDNENDEDEEEEEESEAGEKGNASKSAITWTEDDQKNLMDLGTSELERNQRLENLIARRRARRLMAEKNLIDFDGSDLPFNVPSIATTRRNPFDGPDDSYSNLGLPPIPGSAPSILLPRRNPFDLPYEPNEEKPDLKEDSFRQEFIPRSPTDSPPYHTQQRDNFFFRRHESFSVGPSSLGFLRQDRHDIKWKPYFVPEHFGAEGTSYRSFERQSSGMCESKASSVPDTESVTSTVEQEDKRVSEAEEFLHETEDISSGDRASLFVEHGSVTSEDGDHGEIDEEEEKKRNVRQDEVEITLGDVDGETESQHGIVSSLSEEGMGTSDSAPHSEVHLNGFEVKAEQVEEEAEEEKEEEEEEEEEVSSRASGSSSSSAFSEVKEKINEVKKEGEEASNSQINYPHEELRHRVEEIEFSFITDHHKEPVYDSSPTAVEKYLSFSSDSSVSPANRDSEVLENMQNDRHDENDLRNAEVTESREDNFRQVGLSEFEEILADQNATLESVGEQVSDVSSSPSSGIESVGNDLADDLYFHHDQSSIQPEPSDLSSVSNELSMNVEESIQFEQARILAENVVALDHDLVQVEADYGTEMDSDVQFHDTVERTDTPASSHWHMLSNSSVGSPYVEHPFVPDDGSAPLKEVSEVDDEQLGSDSRPYFDEPNEESELSVVLEEAAVATPSGNPEETYDDGGKDSVIVSTLTLKSPSFSSASSTYESPTSGPDSRDHVTGGLEFGILRRQTTEYYDPSLEIFGSLAIDEVSNEGSDDEIKGIDDGFLMELDTVGDFRVKEIGSGSNDHGFVQGEISQDGHSENESLDQSGSGSQLPVLEARSLEDITTAFRQLHEGADVEEVILPRSIDANSEVLQGTESGLSVIEARSLDDIHVVMQSVEENLQELAVSREQDMKIPEGTESGLPDIEARSPDDIHVVKQIMEDNLDQLPKETDANSHGVEDSVSEGISDVDELKGPSDSTQGSQDLPVLEVRSVEDVTVAFMQLNEGAEVEEVILPSSIKDHQESECGEGHDSALPVVEARSLDDIHNIVKQVVEEEHVSEAEEIVESEDRSVEAEVTQEVILANSVEDLLQDSKSLEGTSSGLPVVEARSLDEQVPKEIVESKDRSLDDEVTQEVTLVNSIEDQQDSKSSEGSSFVEARSLDDTQFLVKQVVDGNHKEVPEEIDESKDPSVKVVNSIEAITVQETSPAVSPAEPKDAEVSTSKLLDSKDRKLKSHKSSSSSGSSSSSSSSDSD